MQICSANKEDPAWSCGGGVERKADSEPPALDMDQPEIAENAHALERHSRA